MDSVIVRRRTLPKRVARELLRPLNFARALLHCFVRRARLVRKTLDASG
jgi:hypothetical protein